MADPTTPSPLSQALAQIGPNAPAAPSMSPLSVQLRSLAADKQARVAQAAEEKKARMDPAQAAMRAAMAREEGNLTGQDPTVSSIGRSTQQVRIQSMRGLDRSNGEVLGDALLGAGAGFVSTVGNVGAAAAGMVSDRAGAVASEAVAGASDWIRDQQTTALTRTRELDAVRGDLDRADVALRYEQDVAAGRSVPGLRRVGREALEQADAFWDNPRLAGDVAAEGAGSMAAITGAAALGVPVPLAVGVTEGAGAYAQTVNDVQRMDEAQLLKTSPDYRALRERGVSHEAARDRLGGQAGRTAGTIQGIVGGLAGNLVKGIEGNPMKLPGSDSLVASLRSFGTDALKETVEETSQAISGTMAGNWAIRGTADETRGIMDNVGAEAVSGAVGGFGTTTALRAPEMAAVGTITAAETAARNLISEGRTIYQGAERLVNERLEKVNAARETDSPVSPARVEEAAVSVDAGLRAAVTALAPTIDESVATVGEAPAEAVPGVEDPVQTAMARIRETIVPMLDIDATEFNSAPQAVRNIASEGQPAPDGFVQPRVDILKAVTDNLENGGGTPEDQAATALWVYEQARRYEALRNEDLSILPQGPADVLSSALSAVDTVLASPSIKRAIQKAAGLESADLGPLPEITAESVATPAVREAVASVTRLAEINPDAVDRRFVAAVLNQNRMGTLSLAPRQVQALESAAEISQAVEDALGDGTEPSTKTRDIVRKEIRNDGFDGKATGTRPSLRQHIQDVTTTLAQGDLALATTQLARLKGLAEHYQNKVAAAQTSARMKTGKDNAVPYRTWTGEDWLEADHKSAGSIYVNPFAPNSIATARAVETEARLVTRVYNALAKAYGAELNAEPLTELKPVPEFEGLGKAKRQPQTPAKVDAAATVPAAGAVAPKPADMDAPSTPSTGDEDQKAKELQENIDFYEKTEPRDPFVVKDIEELARAGKRLPEIARFLGKSELFVEKILKGSDGYRDRARARNPAVFAKIPRNSLWDLATGTAARPADPTKKQKDAPDEPTVRVSDVDARRRADEPAARPDQGQGAQGPAPVPGSDAPAEDGRDAETVPAGKPVPGPADRMDAEPRAADDDAALSNTELRDSLAPDAELLEKLGKSEPSREIGALAPEHLTTIREYLGNISSALGVDVTGFLKTVVSYHNPVQPTNTGYAWWDNQKPFGFSEGVVGIDPAILGNERRLKIALTHEVMHILDDMARGGNKFMVSDNAFLMEGGKIHDEILQAMSDHRAIQRWFAYPMSFENARERASELFAQLGALYILNPEYAERYIPHGTEFIRQVFGRLPGIQEGGEQTAGRADGAVAVAQVSTTGVAEVGASAPVADGDPGVTATGVPDLSALPARDGLNRVQRAYAFGTGRSRLAGVAAPMRFMADWLKSFTEEDQAPFTYEVSPARRQVLVGLLEQQGGTILKKMNARLTDKANTNFKGDKGPITPLETIRFQGKDFLSMEAGRVLNLVDTTTGKYDADLVQGAILAAMDWVMTSDPVPDLDDEKVAKMYGFENEALLTDGARAAARWGYSEVMSATALGQVILDFWNAKGNPEAPMSDSHGIVQALAAEILTAMDGIFVEAQSFALDDKRRQNVFKLTHPATEAQVRALGPARRFFGDAVLKDRPQPYYFDDQLETLQAEGTVSRVFKQKRGPGKVGKRAGDAIEAHRAIQFFRNPGYVRLMKVLGEETYGRLMGLRDFDPALTHVTDAISIAGKNASIRQGYARTLEHDAHLEDYAKAAGKNPDEVATHFDWGVGSNERIMAAGFNGQANKHMRHAYAATVDTLDMTTQDGKERFWLTVAQNTGTKTEKSRRKANGKAARKAIYAKYSGTIEVLTDLLDGTGTLSADQLAVLDREIGAGGDPMLLDALLHVARYKLAQKTARPRGLGGKGDKSALTQFETFLPLEADGKTDGPIHSLVHFLTGPFTATQLADFMRGGLFLGEKGRTLNSVAKMGDLYQRGAALAKAYLKKQIADVSEDPRISASQMAALRLTGQSGVKIAGNKVDLAFDPETGELTIGRNTLKNPLTVTIYGSGQKGIAQKIAGGVVAAFYQNLSALAVHRANGQSDATLTDLPQFADYAEIVRDLKLLTTTRVVKRRRDGQWFRFDTRKDSKDAVPFGNGKAGIQFKLTPENIDILTTNLQFLLVGPLSDGINDIMGGASANLKVVQLATQLQSRVLMGLFDKAVRERLETRKAEGRLAPNEFLSETDYKAVFARLAKYGAIVAPIRNTEHDLVLSAKEKGDAGLSFFRTLDDGFRGNAMLARPESAGVSAAPMLNISRGDATMMVNYFARAWTERNTLEADGSKALRVLPVYDGLNMPAGGLEEISERINAAVTETWLENPMIDVAESFADFLRQGEDGQALDLESLPNVDDFWEDITRFDDTLDPGTLGLADVLTYVNTHLQEIALETQARKNVMKRVGFSNDHMASAETPHEHEGEIYPGPKDDLEGRARWLNRKLDKELVKLRAERDGKAPKTKDGVAKPDAALVKAVKAMGIADSRFPTIRQTNTRGILALLNDPDVAFTPEGKAVLGKLAKLMPRTRFVLGSPEELTAYRNGRYPEQAGMPPIEHGQTDLANGVIYIANQATETVLHEMLHAALMGQLYRYQRFPETLSADEQAAVKNLEALMGQFLSMSFLFEDPEVKAAADLAQATIRSFMDRDDPFARAAMVSEFVSWTLVNQSLAETLKTAKTRVTLSKLGDLVRKAVGAFKRLMGLQDDRLSLFANIAANSAVLLESARPLDVGFRNIPTMALNQLAGLPVDERLSRLAEAFKAKVEDALLKRDPQMRAGDKAKLENRAATIEALVVQGGFDLDPEQANLFLRMQAAFATTVEMDKRALVRVARIYDHAIKTLTVEDLMEDAEANLASDRARAERRLRTLEGQLGTKGGNTDLEGRPMVLSVFLALSQTDESLRRALRSLRLPKDRGLSTESVDALLTSAAESAMNTLASTIAGEGLGNKALGPSLDRLAVILGRIETDRHSLIEKKLGGLLGEGETRVRDMLKEGADRLVEWGQERQSQRPPGEVDTLASGAKALAMLVDEDRAELAAKGVKMWANQWVKGPQVLKDILNEVIGTTDETAAVNLMVNEVRYGVQRMRQEYREDLPKIFADQFTREVTESEWQAMHTGIARADLGAMTASLHMRDIRRMYADAKILKREGDKALEAVKALAKGQSQAVLAKADALARFMVTGQIDPGNHGLQRNAYAIARLMGPKASEADVEAMRAALDRLVTIRAIGHLDPSEKALLETLAREEPAGFEFMVYYAASLRETEAMKIEDSGEIAKLNSYKGYVPMETHEGLRLIVADASDHVALLERGYTRLGEYKGSGFEVGKKSYYVSAVAGKATYNQSALQTVHTTTGGVDPATGTTLTGITAGRILGKEASRIAAAIARGQSPAQGKGKEVLLPLYGHSGQVVGYERHIDPEVRETTRPNQQIDEMLGAWAGRLVEESAASQYNEVLVERLGDRWTEDKKDRNRDWTKEYVNLADPELKDPVLKDIWAMVPREARVHAASVFGEQGVFWVRRDMTHNALGYRMPSVGDLWVGTEPLDPKTMNFLVKATTAFLGKNAFEYLVRGERFAQTAVSVAKNTIVVKSVIVPVFNALSTMKQLMMNGVSPRTMAREYPTKLVEIEQHLKNLDRRVELNAEITAHRRDKARLARLQAELTSIEESSKRMSIWPLIEAGEFMTISEGMTEADAALTSGRWAEYIGNLMDRIPHKLGTVGRYAAITRDTALFQGMARAVQYGDFLGKAVLYDHLTKVEGKTKEQAIRKLHDEFVAYNLLPGRTRSYLESMGLTWFWAFKLRSMKIALRHLRNNPLKSLLVIGGTENLMPDIPGGSVGDPIMDNMLTHVGEGRLGGSIGPGMLWRAPEMHPVLGSIL